VSDEKIDCQSVIRLTRTLLRAENKSTTRELYVHGSMDFFRINFWKRFFSEDRGNICTR